MTINENANRIVGATKDLKELVGYCFGGVSAETKLRDLAPILARVHLDNPTEHTIGMAERTTADGTAIRDGVALLNKIKGKTIVWNNIKSTYTQYLYSGINIDRSSVKWLVSGKIDESKTNNQSLEITKNIDTTHTYLCHFHTNQSGNQSVKSYFMTSSYVVLSTIGEGMGTSIFKSERLASVYLYVYGGGVSYDGLEICVFNCDLTKMFGSGNEPTTIDEFTNRIFGVDSDQVSDADWESISAYCEPTLLSCQPKELVSKSRNLFNADIEQSVIIGSSGKQIKGYLFDLPKGTYYAKCFIQDGFKYPNRYYYLLKVNKNTKQSLGQPIKYFITPVNTSKGSFNIEENEQLFLYNASSVGSQIFDDIKLYNLMIVSGSEEPTEYKAYKETSISINPKTIKDSDGNPLFPDGLRSAGNVCDEIDYENGVAIKRIGSVDLGSLSWDYDSSQSKFKASRNSFQYLFKQYSSNAVSIKYKVVADNYLNSHKDEDKNIALGGTVISCIDLDYTNNSDGLRNAMSGVILYYELAEPIQVPISNIQQVFKASDGGREKITADGVTTPIHATIAYREAVTASEAVEMLAESAGLNE